MAVYSLFSQVDPGLAATADTTAYTMGVQFSVSQAATLSAIWWYSPPTVTAIPTTLALYQVTGTGTGTLIHSEYSGGSLPPWSGAAGSGWIRAAFASPPALTPGVAYKACILGGGGPSNFYAHISNYWDTGTGSGGITNGPLSAPNNAGADGGQDTFNANNTLAYPASSFNATNYWVDVEITTADAASGYLPQFIPPGRQSPAAWSLLQPMQAIASAAAAVSANVTGVGAQVVVAAGVGSTSGGAGITGTGAQVTVAGGIGTPSGGANVAGVGAAVTVAGGTGSTSGSANVTGVGAQVSVAGGIGSPSGGAGVTGLAAQVTVAGGTGTPAGSAGVTGVGAQVVVAGGIGTPSGGSNAAGVAAQVTVSGGIGSPSGSANVAGVGAQVTVGAGTGVPLSGGSANVAGVGAQVTVAGGVGTLSAGVGLAGVGAQGTVAGGAGTLSGGANVTGVAAAVTASGGTGVPSAGGSANVSGIGALVTTAAGIGTLAASANVQGVAALQAVAGGIGTPAGVINGSANVTGVSAIVTVSGGAGLATGGIINLVTVGRTIAFNARKSVTAQATMEFDAGQPVQGGLTTIATDPWIAMYPG